MCTYSGNTADEQLERKNFEHPMKALCELWDDGIRDKHPVKATWTLDESKFEGSAGPTAEEAEIHVRYALCYSEWLSSPFQTDPPPFSPQKQYDCNISQHVRSIRISSSFLVFVLTLGQFEILVFLFSFAYFCVQSGEHRSTVCEMPQSGLLPAILQSVATAVP